MIEFFETEKHLDKDEIRELETELNFNFPDSYKDHLLKYNGGRCEPNVFYFEENGNQTSSILDWFLAIYNGEFDNLKDYFIMYKVDEKRLPNSVFPIAHDPGGNLICMDTINESIYFWDHEKEVDYIQYSDDNRSNLYLIAKSLEKFINNLQKE